MMGWFLYWFWIDWGNDPNHPEDDPSVDGGFISLGSTAAREPIGQRSVRGVEAPV